jgi:hypothetical protein
MTVAMVKNSPTAPFPCPTVPFAAQSIRFIAFMLGALSGLGIAAFLPDHRQQAGNGWMTMLRLRKAPDNWKSLQQSGNAHYAH